MNKTLLGTSVVFLVAGCVNPPPPVSREKVDAQSANTRLLVDRQVHVMSRAEVAAAVNECESAGMRAVVINSRRMINDTLVPAPVDVTCMPRFKP